jgi:hypothetical protein
MPIRTHACVRNHSGRSGRLALDELAAIEKERRHVDAGQDVVQVGLGKRLVETSD